MKRLHLHIGVERLEEAIQFYSNLFGAEPIKHKPDYAKWMLEDPHVNFAISTRVATKGIDHLGIQVDEEQELTEIRTRLTAGQLPTAEQGETICCYAKSDKTWVVDPAGIAWETYRTMEEAETFSSSLTQPDTLCCKPSLFATPQSQTTEPTASNCCN